MCGSSPLTLQVKWLLLETRMHFLDEKGCQKASHFRDEVVVRSLYPSLESQHPSLHERLTKTTAGCFQYPPLVLEMISALWVFYQRY